uniref:Uncharacterized protein n=1 Tax=Physcomitrium patens TaxID=3218 RepID=A0A2K1K717_PHYPA|nr:hypothetical protein PHYPA_011479 [Physcomitrium patens]
MFCPSNSVDYGRHSSCCNGRCGTDFLRCQHRLRWHQGWHASLDFCKSRPQDTSMFRGYHHSVCGVLI